MDNLEKSRPLVYQEVIVTVNLANVRSAPSELSKIITRMVKGAKLAVIGSTNNWFRVSLYNNTPGWISKKVVKLNRYYDNKPLISNLSFYTQEEGPSLPGSFKSFAANTSSISEVALFMFRMDKENPTQIEKFGTFSDNDVKNLIAIAHRNNVKIMPVVHNLLYRPGGSTASKDVVSAAVASFNSRQTLARNILNLIERYGFDGVHLDIEDVYIKDSQKLTLLYQQIANTIRPKGYFFSASIPARVSDSPVNPFSDPFNYSDIGKTVDEFVVMLYNEHGWPGSGPGPVVSIGWMQKVLNYAIGRVPKNKLMAAVSVFGFDFNLSTKKNKYVTYQAAMSLANKYNKRIIFDEKTKTPTFSYVDGNGNRHEVWFENSRSIYEKAKLASSLGIKGLALWRLGMEDPNMWNMLKNDVIIRK